ncbi:MAG: PTS sugar transporter subunit IIA [Kiritimatiellae bacterium]|nr:PTS sugar transporter subunit IIA [Kiritimatiellia bacterium]
MNSYAELLDRAIVVNSLKSEDMFGAIAELTDALVAEGLLAEDKRDEAKQAIVRREMSASTVMTDEIALPHGRTDVVNELICAIGLHKEGFAADAPDGLPTRVVVLMLVPIASGAGYIKFLGTVSRMLMDDEKRAAMVAATDRDSVLKILRDA